MAQYGGEQYGREGRQTDEFGHPLRQTDQRGGEQFGREVRQTDEFGNPVRKTDEYGHVRSTGGTMGSYDPTGIQTSSGHDTGRHAGITGHGTGDRRTPAAAGGVGVGAGQHGYTRGGEHEKGTMEKIKEKLPGVGGHESHEQRSAGATTERQQGGEYAGEPGYKRGEEMTTGHEKKGMMEKIKEKLPGTGSHHTDENRTSTTTPGAARHLPK